MSLYRHKRTGVLYRVIMSAFSVERQVHQNVYMSLDTGEAFTRDQIPFAQNFELVSLNPQQSIVPKEQAKAFREEVINHPAAGLQFQKKED